MEVLRGCPGSCHLHQLLATSHQPVTIHHHPSHRYHPAAPSKYHHLPGPASSRHPPAPIAGVLLLGVLLLDSSTHGCRAKGVSLDGGCCVSESDPPVSRWTRWMVQPGARLRRRQLHRCSFVLTCTVVLVRLGVNLLLRSSSDSFWYIDFAATKACIRFYCRNMSMKRFAMVGRIFFS